MANTSAVPGAPPSLELAPLQNRFHVATVASQRVVQLQNGARPRIDPGQHKHCAVAVEEVMAGAVSWFLA
jgi:DNA-directed RNA polymerase subunit K/omega